MTASGSPTPAAIRPVFAAYPLPPHPLYPRSAILERVCLMRWLLIVLLVSLAGMLYAAAGVAHYIRQQRNRDRGRPSTALEPVEQPDADGKP